MLRVETTENGEIIIDEKGTTIQSCRELCILIAHFRDKLAGKVDIMRMVRDDDSIDICAELLNSRKKEVFNDEAAEADRKSRQPERKADGAEN